MKVQTNKNELLFLNTPLSDISCDIVGVNKYVDKLDAAIDEGAQMIAITAPFGAGKTSIIEFLENKRKSKKREKILKISMWSQFHGDNNNGSTNDLHRSFIYQLISQININKGDYLNRRLSPNYGLFKIHINSLWYWIWLIVAALAMVLCWFIHSFPTKIVEYVSWLEGKEEHIIIVCGLVAVFIMLCILTRAEIVFSSLKSAESKREIESSEIMALYRKEILKSVKPWGVSYKYIVVIEDLDRTSDAEAVVGFLKELRKYYIPQGKDEKYKNAVTFIVNVKPEAILCEDKGKVEDDSENRAIEKQTLIQESLYAKLFDYTLNLQTINVDNYDVIVEGLLKANENKIKKLGLQNEFSKIPGIKWIIRERRLGIREIKERLNIAFSLYESLKQKFPEKNDSIAFENCAVVAYLKTAFEKDFYGTEDRAFQKLVNLYLKEKLTLDVCKAELPNSSLAYIETVKELIEAKLIDSSYRTYFYNYPKGSYLYSLEESQVVNAILYKERVDNLEEIVLKIMMLKSKAIERAFQTLEQLGLSLPYTVFESESLYCFALKKYEQSVLRYFDNLEYNSQEFKKNIQFFKKILKYDFNREVYSYDKALKFCKKWEEHFTEMEILKIRQMLCLEFSSEIQWYKPLFYNVHTLISKEEISVLAIKDVLVMTNIDNEELNIEIIKYIFTRYIQDNQETVENEMEVFLRKVGGVFEAQEMVLLYLEFMIHIKKIIPDFEEQVYLQLSNEENTSEFIEEVFVKYQELINQNSTMLSKITIENICNLQRYEGYNSNVTKKIEEQKNFISYVLLLKYQGEKIPFEQQEIRQALFDNKIWLLGRKKDFIDIRLLLVQCEEDTLLQYMFLFDKECPVLTEEELNLIKGKKSSDEIVMKILPVELVTLEVGETVCDFFNRKNHTNNSSYEILKYISKFTLSVVKNCFYQLDFDKIKYRNLAKARKEEIKIRFEKSLKLDDEKEKIHFMQATRFLDTSWEIELHDVLLKDKILRDAYISCVNSVEKISKGTIEILCSFGVIYAMSEQVNKKYLELKKYKEFIISQTLEKKKFELVEGDLRQELWPVYIEVFSCKGKYMHTKEYMTQNKEFINEIIRRKLYIGWEAEIRILLCGVYQDKDSIEDVILYGEEFALKYYSSMEGFLDEEAAATFVSILEKHTILLASDKLYSHTHEKLINGRLKAKYTNLRKKVNVH